MGSPGRAGRGGAGGGTVWPALAMVGLVAFAAWCVPFTRGLAGLQEELASLARWQDELNSIEGEALGLARSPGGAAGLRDVEKRLLLLQDEMARRAPDREALHDLARQARATAASIPLEGPRREHRAAALLDHLHFFSGQFAREQARVADALDDAWLAVEVLVVTALLLAVLAFALVLAASRARRRARVLAAEVEEKTRDADVRARFVSTLSHEVRNPITAIVGTAELLGRTELTLRQRDMVEVLSRAGQSLIDLVDGVLDLSRIEAGRLELEIVEMDVLEVVEAVAMLFAGRAEEKGLDLSVTADGDVPHRLLTDPGRIRQVLTNLVGNAIKFTSEGEVSIHVSRIGAGAAGESGLAVSVRDTGPGVPAAVRDRIFEAFAQGDAGTSRRHGGSGLGLAISRRLVELMGGALVVHDAPGGGAVFRFSIAAVEAPGRAPEEALPPPAAALVVGGSEADRSALLRQMTAWGWRARAEATAAAGLERFREAALRAEPPRVVVLGETRGGPEPGETANAFRALAGREATSLVRVVTFSQGQATGNAPESLFAARLAKPLRPSRLRRALAISLGTSRPARTSETEEVRPPPAVLGGAGT